LNRPKTALPPVLKAFLIGATMLSASCLLAEYLCGHYLHLDRDPYNTLTFATAYDFMDIRMFPLRFEHFHTPSFFGPNVDASPFLYPAPCALLYRLLYALPHPVRTFLLLLIFIDAVLAVWFARTLVLLGLKLDAAVLFATGALLTSYPLYVEFNRANIEIFVWGLSALGILAFFRNRPWLAATLIALAGACKGYPYIYLGLLFARKQYRQTIYSLLLGAFVNLFSMWAITGDLATGRRGVAEGLKIFRSVYILRPNAVGLDHSLFAVFKRFASPLPPPEVLGHILTAYLVVAGILALFVYFVRVYSMPPLNQLIFLTVACTILPPTSYDYTLLHLYTPWVMLVFLAVAAWRDNRRTPAGLWPAFICLTVLLSPQNEIIHHGQRFEGQIKCLALLALAIVALRFPFPRSSSEGQDQSSQNFLRSSGYVSQPVQ
jgi:hypothetical protein